MRNFTINYILISYGTRPEIIKLSPIIRELDKRGISFKTVFTGQHRELYDDVKDLVPEPDFHLAIMKENQTLTDILSSISLRFGEILRSENPDLLIVQGDTSTVAVSALIAFYEKVPVGHVEAGLRSFDRSMPEEINRILTDQISDLLFITSHEAEVNLLKEGKDKDQIHFVGNTMIDSLIRF